MLRICVFETHPDTILVQAQDGDPVSLPVLRAPFTKPSVAAALRTAGVKALVVETVAGRWTRAAIDARAAERGASGERATREAALRAQAMRSSVDPGERDRARMSQRIAEIAAEQRVVNAKISEAATHHHRTGLYVDRHAFVALQSRRDRLKEEMTAVQAKMTSLKVAQKAVNVAAHAKEQEVFANRFLAAAKEVLDRETLAALVAMASDDGTDGDE